MEHRHLKWYVSSDEAVKISDGPFQHDKVMHLEFSWEILNSSLKYRLILEYAKLHPLELDLDSFRQAWQETTYQWY